MPKRRLSFPLSVAFGAAAALAAIVFHPLLRVGFVGDDFSGLHYLVHDRPWTQMLGRVPDYYHYLPVAFGYWKSLDTVLGTAGGAWHAVAIGLYLGAALLAGLVLRRILRSDFAPALAVVLFASFYANYEVVAFSIASVYLVSLCLLLGALACYPAGPEAPGRWRYGASMALGALSYLAFEAGLVFLPMIVLLEYEEGGARAVLRRWRRFVLPSLMVVAYLAAWFTGAGDVLGSDPSAVGVAKKTLTTLLYLSVFNVPVVAEAYFAGPYGARVVVSLALTLLVTALMVRGSRRVRLLILWALLAMVPTLVLSGHHPRYFLFSSVPVSALWALALVGLDRWMGGRGRVGRWARPGAVAVACVCVMALSGAWFQRDRIAAWVRTDEAMTELREASTRFLSAPSPPDTVVVVDAPAMEGPYHDVRWPAYLFLSAFNDGAVFAMTPPFRVPSTVLLLRTEAPDPSRPVVATDSVDAQGIQRLVEGGALVFRYRPDLSLQILTNR